MIILGLDGSEKCSIHDVPIVVIIPDNQSPSPVRDFFPFILHFNQTQNSFLYSDRCCFCCPVHHLWMISNTASLAVLLKRGGMQRRRCRTLWSSVTGHSIKVCVKLSSVLKRTRQREMKEFNVRKEQGSFLHEWWPGSCIRLGATLWFHWMKGHTNTHTRIHTHKKQTLKAYTSRFTR